MITVVFIATCGMLLLSSTVYETCLSRNSEVHRLKRNKAWHLDQLKVPAAWNHGFTGKGVVVSTVDDGIQMNHPALAPNYDPLASSNTLENNNDPSPSEDDHSHGTMCAGLVRLIFENSRVVLNNV
jgi:subtilisin family serine protease